MPTYPWAALDGAAGSSQRLKQEEGAKLPAAFHIKYSQLCPQKACGHM